MKIKTKMIIKVIVVLLISMILQLLFLPTLCGASQNVAKFYVAIAVDTLIPLRLMYKPTKVDINLYLTILLTSFIWIHLFMIVLRILMQQFGLH